jgi:ribosomal protein S18 acetylase RimI-like enzyme
MKRRTQAPVGPYSLRPVTAGDYSFLRELNEATTREAVDATWGWDDETQDARFRERFAPGVGCIVVVEGRDVGFLHAVHGEDEIFIAEIQVSAGHQGRGLGTSILRDVIEQADSRGQPVVLSVLKANRARRLYDRLGFRVVAEDEARFFMELSPASEENS